MPRWRPKGAMWKSWALLPRALRYLRPYRRPAIGAVLLTVVLAVLSLAEPWPLALIVDKALSGRPAPDWIAAIAGDSAGGLILFAVLASLGLALANGGVNVLNEYLTTRVNERMVLDLRSEMFQHAQKLSQSFHDESRTGVLMYQINNQADTVGAVVVALPPLAQSAFTLIGMVWIATRIDLQLALLAMSVVPFIWYSTHRYGNRVEPELHRVRGLEGQNLSIVHEAMAMLRVIVAFGREKHEYARFRKQGEETVDARVRLTVRQSSFQLMVNFITAAGTALVLGFGAHKVLDDQITGGQLLVVLAYVAQVYGPLEMLTTSMAQFQENFIGLQHAFDLLDTPIEVEEKPDAFALEEIRHEIHFENVGFSYSTRKDTLKDISFGVPAGHAIAIVGPTGAGKSTLVSLMPRFYDAAHGRVLIDGHDVRDLTLESLRDQYSIVLQEPLLFSGTIAANIGYGRPGATQDEVEEAAKAANAHDFIVRLPKGYDTELGERGTKISGGERQRIAVARAFLRDAPILILDEPTSSIDSKTETVILDALEKLMEGRTTVMIAHRLSTVRGVDEILVLDEGEIVQRGTHEELVEQEGLYRNLWDAQTRVRGPRRRVAEQLADVGPEDLAASIATELADTAIAAAHGEGSTARDETAKTGDVTADAVVEAAEEIIHAAAAGNIWNGTTPRRPRRLRPLVARRGSAERAMGTNSSNGSARSHDDRLVDLNVANIGQLLSLQGVGPTLAQAIEARREEVGRFERTEDLLSVPGFGEARLRAIADLVTVGGRGR